MKITSLLADGCARIRVVSFAKTGQRYRARAAVLLSAAIISAWPISSFAETAPQMFGVNLSGGEHNSTKIPGLFGTDYAYPSQAEMDYYKARNMKLIRLPILWERIQATVNATLLSGEITRIDTAIGYARNNGMKVILDLHNYNSYKVGGVAYQVGTTQVPVSALANVWSQLAAHYKDEQAIYGYDVMNEPSGTLAEWQPAAQAAVDAIRTQDTVHWVFVEGIKWSGTQQWRAYNETFHVTDSADRLIYSGHSYWSPNHDNTYSSYATASHNVDLLGIHVSGYPEMGIDHLEPFVEWIKEHGYNGHVGEYGVPTVGTYSGVTVTSAEAALWNTVLDKALTYLENNGLSGTYWTGGARMAGNAYNLGCQPASLTGGDKSVMDILKKHAGEIVFETESIGTATSTDAVSVFTDPLLSYGAAEKLASNAVGDYIDYTVPVPLAGNYTVKVGIKKYSVARGRFQLAIDGVNQGAVQDQYGPSGYAELDLGAKNFTAGAKSFKFTVTGKNSGSSGYELTFDYIKLVPIAPTLVQATADNIAATVTGTWTPGNGTEGYFSTNYFSDAGTGKGTKTIRFIPNILSTGTYQVYGRWVGSGSSRSAHVPLEIVHAGGTDTTKWVNQQVGGGSWVLIGTYTFNAGTGGSVLVNNTGTTGIVMADAFRFIKQ